LSTGQTLPELFRIGQIESACIALPAVLQAAMPASCPNEARRD
jgi:hypothetical protein